MVKIYKWTNAKNKRETVFFLFLPKIVLNNLLSWCCYKYSPAVISFYEIWYFLLFFFWFLFWLDILLLFNIECIYRYQIIITVLGEKNIFVNMKGKIIIWFPNFRLLLTFIMILCNWIEFLSMIGFWLIRFIGNTKFGFTCLERRKQNV